MLSGPRVSHCMRLRYIDRRLCLGPTMSEENTHIYIYIYIRIQNIYEALPPCTLRAVPSLICYMRALPSFMRAFALIHMRPCCCILPLPHPTCLPWACNPISLSLSIYIYVCIKNAKIDLQLYVFGQNLAEILSPICFPGNPNMLHWTGPIFFTGLAQYSSLDLKMNKLPVKNTPATLEYSSLEAFWKILEAIDRTEVVFVIGRGFRQESGK